MNMNTQRAWVEIDLEALKHNYLIAKKTGKKVMCVVKSDAYGHGAVRCSKYLEDQGADAFAVACLDEAITLRVLVLGYTDPRFVAELEMHDITQSLLSEDYALHLNKVAAAAGVKVRTHIQLDTGMSRVGILAQGQENHVPCAEAVRRILRLGSLKVEGIYTHLSCADCPDKADYTKWQVDNFRSVTSLLQEEIRINQLLLHAANSAGILFHPDTHFDMVREGCMLYGFPPTGGRKEEQELRPVLTFRARVGQIKEIPANTYISYGATYRTEKPATIAVVTVGYADSYPRDLSGKGAWALINGMKCTQIGRICMDQCMFDVTGKNVAVGDEVILYGGGGALRTEQIAAMTGTIPHELVCLLTARVKKFWK